jgi:uncharacterized protein (UPF0335 family)
VSDLTMTASLSDGEGGTITTKPFTVADLKRATETLRKAQGKPPMKPDPTFDAAADNAYRVTAEELRQFIERFERLDAEKKDIADQQKEVMAEAKARGYCVKTIRKLISERKKEPAQRSEEAAVFELYAEALGL